PEMHRDTPDQEEHNEHPCQRQAASSPSLPEYSRVRAVLTQNAIYQYHQICPSRSCPTRLSDIKAALCSQADPILTHYGACAGVPLTSPGSLVTLAQRHEHVRDVLTRQHAQGGM